MKIVFHEKYKTVYSGDPASAPGRIEAIYNEIAGKYDFVKPSYADENDIYLAHSIDHILHVKSLKKTYEIALLAVGGSIMAAEIALSEEPSFGLIRPPGHHAGRNSSWGFCYFNNIAIAILKLLNKNKIRNAFIIDFDLHFGDGTENIFYMNPKVIYYHLPPGDSETQLYNLETFLNRIKSDIDIVGVSAGFDRHIEDWGGVLSNEDYYKIGRIIAKFAKEKGKGRVFSVLEGGYNHNVLGKAVKAYLEGIDSEL